MPRVNFARDAEPETVPRRLLVTSCPIEALKNVWSTFRWNSGTVVADTNLHHVIMVSGRNQNLTARSIIFYGILHQVLQCQRNHFLVTDHRESFRNVSFDLKIVPGAQDPRIFQTSIEQFAQVELGRAQSQPAGIGPGKQQQIFGYRIEPARLLKQVGYTLSTLVG